jgi:hypothetical protein
MEAGMNIRDEHDLRVWLDTALDDFAPGPLPLQAVVRQGRSVLIRRRVTVAVAAAVLVAGAVATPTILHRLSQSPLPPVGTHYHVTVIPPGPGSPKGLIATVGIDSRRWRITAVDQGGTLCFSGFSQPACAVPTDQSGDPASTGIYLGSRPVVVQVASGGMSPTCDSALATARFSRCARCMCSAGRTQPTSPSPCPPRKW